MAADTTTEGFGAKPSSDEEPDNSWELDRLGEYVRQQHEAIVRGEQTLAPCYWKLGQALELAQHNFNRGQWGRFLVSLGVHKVRASKARAIYRRFATPDDLSNLAVEEAYEQRERRQVYARRKTSRDGSVMESAGYQEEQDTLAVLFAEIVARADKLVDSAAFTERDERTNLFGALRHAIERLEYLGRLLGMEDEQGAGQIGK